MSPSPVRKSPSSKRDAARRPPAPARAARRAASPAVAAEATKPAPKPLAKGPGPAKKPARKNEARKIRGTFTMPEADHALIAKLKLAAKRSGLKVKKSELLRLGLRALDALGAPELRDRVLSLRTQAKPGDK